MDSLSNHINLWAIIATGPSLNDEEIKRVQTLREQGKINGVIAVNNAGLDKANWADALVSHDAIWWRAYPEALNFKGRKFSKHNVSGTEKADCIVSGCNSGLLAMFVARDIFLANHLLLFGFDFSGSHYFGPHTAKFGNRELRNTSNNRFLAHIKQFDEFKGPKVINCNMLSHLNKFPKLKFSDIVL